MLYYFKYVIIFAALVQTFASHHSTAAETLYIAS